MVLLASLLTFLSISLFVVAVAIGHDRRAKQRLENELIKKIVTQSDLEQFDESTLLRDEDFSRFGTLNRVLDGMKVATNLSRLLVQADMKIRVGTMMMLMAVLGVIGFLIGNGMYLGIILSIALGVVIGSFPYVYVLVRRKRRFAAFEAQFPETVDLIARAIRAGHAFTTGIKMAGDEMPDPVGKEFRRIFAEQNLGLPIRTALSRLLERVELVDLKLFVVAVLIQRQSGGNLAEILDKISYTIRERFRILRQLKVHTAQAKMTGIILTTLPPVVGAIIYTLNYEYIKIIFQETLGLQILMGAAILQIVGFLWIRKIVNIEV